MARPDFQAKQDPGGTDINTNNARGKIGCLVNNYKNWLSFDIKMASGVDV